MKLLGTDFPKRERQIIHKSTIKGHQHKFDLLNRFDCTFSIHWLIDSANSGWSKIPLVVAVMIEQSRQKVHNHKGIGWMLRSAKE